MLLQAHIKHAQATSTGLAIPADVESDFAAIQAAWRFWANDTVTPHALVEPLRELARRHFQEKAADYALAVIDWSKIDYKKHTAKKDLTRLTHEYDVGYELTTQLLVDAETGLPIAPIQAHLKTADGYLTTARTSVPDAHRLEQIAPLMTEADTMKLGVKLVHVIDREADSVWHFRQWDSMGQYFVVRGDDRLVDWRGQTLRYSEIAAQLDVEGGFKESGAITIKDKKGVQYVAETTVVLNRPAKRKVQGRSVEVSGEPLSLRLLIVRAHDAQNEKLLSTWYLLSNAPPSASAFQIALWYYWRWSIESYFKLMKRGGHELEHWQQESGGAILKRLLVASMASATVWRLRSLQSPESLAFQGTLARLSGKSGKRGCPPTAGTLLSGLFVFLQMFDFLQHIDFDLSKLIQLRAQLKEFAPHLIE